MSDEQCHMCDNGKILKYEYTTDVDGNVTSVPVEAPCPNTGGHS